MNPITRFRLFLEKQGLWDSDKEVALRRTSKKEVMAALQLAESSKKPPISQMFEDVYDTLPIHLQQQADEMKKHLNKYGEHYQLGSFDEEEDYTDPVKTTSTTGNSSSSSSNNSDDTETQPR